MHFVDLTQSDEDEISCVKKKQSEYFESYNQNLIQMNNDVFNFFYSTEDLCEQYLSIQRQINRKVIKNHYSVKCPKCNLQYLNCNFLNHIIDHFKHEYSWLDSLLFPKISNLSNTIYNDAAIERSSLPRCEICCLDFNSSFGLGQHLESKHAYQDMPYVCFICNFYRTSFLSQLKQHFYDYHKSTEFIICPFCISPFELPLISQSSGILDANQFVVHMEKHLLKKQFSCDKCTLKFITKLSLIYHRTVYHEGRAILNGNGEFADKSGNSNKIIKKSLNVIDQPIDVSKLTINSFKLTMACAECRENISSLSQHYQSFNLCTQCGFRSYCVNSFRKHMKSVHGQIDLLNYNSIDIYQRGVIICECGYHSMHGDKMASHLCECSQNTCYIKVRLDELDISEEKISLANGNTVNDFFSSINLKSLKKTASRK